MSLAVAALSFAACSIDGSEATTTSAVEEPPTTTVESTTTTTTTPTTTTIATTSSSPEESATTASPLDIDVEVSVPEGGGPYPAVVLVHGGGWVAGSPAIMRPLARHLADAGFLTVNAGYQLAGEVAGFPDAIDDVACAVRFAAAHPDSDGSVAVVGHSAGAHIGAVVALTGDQYGGDCPVEGSGIPDKLVGLAGPYEVNRLGLLMVPFFGAGPAAAPDEWFAGNPLNLVDENAELMSLLMHGDKDGLVDYSFAADFDEALQGAGSESLIEVVEGAAHPDMHDPEVVGDLIIVWLER